MGSFVYSRKPPSARILMERYRDGVRKRLQPIAKAHAESRRRVVSNWSQRSKPRFFGKTVVTVGRIGIEVTVIEKNRQRPLWKWIDQTGTKAHVIRPKASNRFGRLFFQAGNYQPKTSARPARFGGAGRVVGGRLAVARSVNHPGFKPRKFSQKINKDLRKPTIAAIRNAGRDIKR